MWLVSEWTLNDCIEHLLSISLAVTKPEALAVVQPPVVLINNPVDLLTGFVCDMLTLLHYLLSERGDRDGSAARLPASLCAARCERTPSCPAGDKCRSQTKPLSLSVINRSLVYCV